MSTDEVTSTDTEELVRLVQRNETEINRLMNETGIYLQELARRTGQIQQLPCVTETVQ